MSAPPLVTCVGIAVLDVVLRVDRLPAAPGKYRAAERREVGGGVAATAAATVAALGGRARFLGAVGADPAGDRIVAGLTELGVDAAGVRRVAGQESPLSMVLVDQEGERLIVNHAGPELFTAAAAVRPAELAGAAAVLADMRWPNGAVSALEAARALGVPGVLDCDHDPTGADAVLAAASHVVFALPTLAAFTGAADPAEALRRAGSHTAAWVAATAGGDGVYWLDGGALRHLPSFPVEVVDTLGAGDVFHGAFALALAEGRAVEEALRFGAAAAAVKCTRFGGAAGVPTRAETMELMEGAR